jgi:hypothetical protein
MFDYFIKPTSNQIGSSNQNNKSNQINEEKSDFEKLLEFIESNVDKRSKLIREIEKLAKEDSEFINNKSNELLQIDIEISNDSNFNSANNSNLNTKLKTLQFNVLSLFILSKVKNPDCADDLKKIIAKFNTKIKNINDIVERNLTRDLSKESESSASLKSNQPSKIPSKESNKPPFRPPGSANSGFKK